MPVNNSKKGNACANKVTSEDGNMVLLKGPVT
jgi:hypothetical protein